MIANNKISMFITVGALLTMMAAWAPASVAAPRGDGYRDFGNHGERHYDGVRHRQFGHRSHRNRGFSFSVPGFRFYSGDSGSCGYSYRKWQSTGSRYWRSRYYDCRHG